MTHGAMNEWTRRETKKQTNDWFCVDETQIMLKMKHFSRRTSEFKHYSHLENGFILAVYIQDLYEPCEFKEVT